MPRFLTRLALLALLLLPCGLSAQVPAAPSPEQLERMMAVARLMMNPAAQLLAHGGEVGLSEAQFAAIRPISEEMDRVVDRIVAWQREIPQRSVSQRLLADPSLPLDEAAVRAEAHENAEKQAELMIATIRTTRAIFEHLTPSQRQSWLAIHARESMRMVQGMVPQP